MFLAGKAMGLQLFGKTLSMAAQRVLPGQHPVKRLPVLYIISESKMILFEPSLAQA
jgi:hypothetical protein